MTITQLDLLSISHDGEEISGSFSICCHELNIIKIFSFEGVLSKREVRLVIYKDKKVFVEQNGIITRTMLDAFSEQQKILLSAFTALYRASRGELKLNGRKVTKFQNPISDDKLLDLIALCR